jgi:hypothetical protein
MEEHPHLAHPSVVEAQRAWEDHVEECPTCTLASSHRTACPEGLLLHSQVVVTAQEAYRVAQPQAFAPESHRDG